MRKSYLLVAAIGLVLAFLAGTKYGHRATTPATHTRHVLYYVDPMHPAYKSDKPGIAPDCGMELVPVYADEAGAAKVTATAPAGTISISADKQQLIGVKFATVEKASGKGSLRLYGRVVPDENRVYPINAGTEGFVRDLSSVTTGSQVRKDQWLATIYSADSRIPVQLFLSTLDVVDAARKRGSDAEVGPAVDSSNFAERRLQSIGMSKEQIEEIRKTRRSPLDLKLASPGDGFVIARNIALGQKYDKGMEFYRIANLDRVWVVADVAESDASLVKPGSTARVWLPGRSKAVDASVMQVLPQVDPTTRTLKVRLDVANPAYVLRPDMFVDVELPTPASSGLMIASEAVLDSGDSRIVFVERGEGVFEPRKVETGARAGDKIQVLSGLQAGDRIVVSGNFLIGSEARLHGVLPSTPAEAVASRKVVDPSCGMEINTAEAEAAGHIAEYKQVKYHFCSDGCKRKFLADPDKFVNAAGAHHKQVAANVVPDILAAHHD
jgi:membrane fusion protein, copper/silver efflux system